MLSWLVAGAVFFGAIALRARRLPSVLLWLGRVSYSYYLWHIPVLMALALAYPTRGASAWLLLLTALVLTGVVAELCFRAIEQPGIRLGRRLARALSQPESRAKITAAR